MMKGFFACMTELAKQFLCFRQVPWCSYICINLHKIFTIESRVLQITPGISQTINAIIKDDFLFSGIRSMLSHSVKYITADLNYQMVSYGMRPKIKWSFCGLILIHRYVLLELINLYNIGYDIILLRFFIYNVYFCNLIILWKTKVQFSCDCIWLPWFFIVEASFGN